MERRVHRRRPFWLPVEVNELEGGYAIGHDASDNGLLLVTPTTIDVGKEVSVSFRIPPGGLVEVKVKGEVVRVTENDEDPDGLWPYKIALRFNEPMPQLEAYLGQLKTPVDR